MLIHAEECIYHGRKSNLVEFQILPVESPIGVSTNLNVVESKLQLEFLLVENPIKEIWVLPWGPKSIKLVDSPTAQNLDEETVLQALHAQTNNWALVKNNAAAEA